MLTIQRSFDVTANKFDIGKSVLTIQFYGEEPVRS